jgi:hypothetical protein
VQDDSALSLYLYPLFGDLPGMLQLTERTLMHPSAQLVCNINDSDLYTAHLFAKDKGYTHRLSSYWITDERQALDRIDALSVVQHQSGNAYLVCERECSIVYLSLSGRELTVIAYARKMADAARATIEFREIFPEAAPVDDAIDIDFWYDTPNEGAKTHSRRLAAPSWRSIAANYPGDTVDQLGTLMRHSASADAGKLILWQGLPGCGKTWALRALAREWKTWARMHYVLDPERFFNSGDYLLKVILGGDDKKIGAVPEWRLIVLEDTGELLSADAKERVGQGLGRLLNLCDGLVGQGLRVMVLITTNEEIGALHSAVIRPGRCLTKIQFKAFDVAAQKIWLESHNATIRPGAKQRTLAELYDIVNGGTDAPKSDTVGFLN